MDTFEFYDDRAFAVVASSIVVAIGYLALGWALTYLASAVRARRPALPQRSSGFRSSAGRCRRSRRSSPRSGRRSSINDFLNGDRTVDAAAEIGSSGIGLFAQLLGLPGALALALAVVFVSLNAMRVGLLTRFMGVLGIITGVLQILPFGGPLPVVQCFWMLMLAILFLGRWPNGSRPRGGPARPSRGRPRRRSASSASARRPRSAARSEPPAAPAEEPVAAGPSPAARRRKRKRK